MIWVTIIICILVFFVFKDYFYQRLFSDIDRLTKLLKQIITMRGPLYTCLVFIQSRKLLKFVMIWNVSNYPITYFSPNVDGQLPSFWNLEIYKIVPAEESQYYPSTTPPETACKFKNFDVTVLIGRVYSRWGIAITTLYVCPHVSKKIIGPA